MRRPLVSVVLPTHNRAPLLARAIRSVLAQTYREFELLVIDDASTDATPDVVRSFGDPRVRYLRLDPNRRVAGARNAGIREAAGDVVAFLDDDDFWLIQKLERQLPALLAAAPDVGLNFCGHISLDPDRARYIGGADAFAGMDFEAGFSWRFGLIATPGWLARKSFLVQAGLFDERLRIWEDWELALRLRDICRFEHLDEALFVQDRRRHLDKGSWDYAPAFADSMALIVERHEGRWAGRPDVRARHDVIVGRGRLLFGMPAEARRWLARAVRTEPGNAKARVLLALSYLGPAGSALAGLVARARARWHALVAKARL